MSILISIIILIISILFVFNQPKNINDFYGYRTFKSKKNIENWKYSNNFFATYFLYISIFNLIISLILEFYCNYEFSIALSILLVIEVIILIILTENKLK